MNDIKDTYLVVNTDTKVVFGHYDTPCKANGQVKRKGSGYAVYVVSAVYPLVPPKKVIIDLTNDKYIENLEDCKSYMEEIMVDAERSVDEAISLTTLYIKENAMRSKYPLNGIAEISSFTLWTPVT